MEITLSHTPPLRFFEVTSNFAAVLILKGFAVSTVVVVTAVVTAGVVKLTVVSADLTVVTGAVVTLVAIAGIVVTVVASVTAGFSVINGTSPVVTAGAAGTSPTLLSYLILFSLANFSAYESFGQWIVSVFVLFEKVPLCIEVRLAGRVTSVSTSQ